MSLSGITQNSEKFLLHDVDIYVDDDSQPTFYADAKTFGFSPEFAEYRTGIPKILVRKDLIGFGISVAFTVRDWTAIGFKIARGGKSVAGGGYSQIKFGTDFEEPTTHKWTFIGKTVDDKIFQAIIYKGRIAEMPDTEVGGGDYAMLGFSVEAVQDTTKDASEDLAEFDFED